MSTVHHVSQPAPGRGLFAVLGALGLSLCLVLGCTDEDTPGPDAGVTPDRGSPVEAGGDLLPDRTAADTGGIVPGTLGLSAICPGGVGCRENSGALSAGAAAVSISPRAYEKPRVGFLEEQDHCVSPTPKAPFGLTRCGKLLNDSRYSRKDCGLDGLCPGETITTRIACSSSAPCPGGMSCDAAKKRCLLKYSAPDADGSEKDGAPDWFLDCGRDQVCPCLDPQGEPAYYSADKKTCLTGHSKNPAYSAPDADGSEGNGTFEGLWMGGFHGNHPILGVHDDLWARALVFRSGQSTVAVVSLDLVGFFYDQVQQVRAAVAAKLGAAEVDYILISSTHGHEGPDTMGQWGPAQAGIPIASGIDQKYLARVVEKTAEAVTKAVAALKPATVSVGQVTTPRQGYVRDSRDPRIYELQLTALQVSAAAGKKEVLATLVNWGNHPEVLSSRNSYVTSDFVHYVRAGLEQGLPAAGSAPALPAVEGVAIYLQGAVGCLMTPLSITISDRAGKQHSGSDWAKARALGENLVAQAHKALAAAKALSGPTVSLWAKELLLPVENTIFQMSMQFNLFERKVYDYDPTDGIGPKNMPKLKTEVSLVRVGPVTFYSLPGEIDPEVLVGGYDGSFSHGDSLVASGNKNPPDLTKAPKGPYLKARVPGTYKMVVGLGNDELGYLVPSWNYQLGKPAYLNQAEGDHYEETNSLGPKTMDLLLSAYSELLKQVK